MSNSSSPAVTPLPIDGPPNEEPTHDLKESVSRTIVGNANSFGIWSPHEGWDLTHPDTPDSPPVQPRIHLQCEISNVAVDPVKTALLIIDMQNMLLSSAYSPPPALRAAEQSLLDYAIPAARKLGFQIVWLNWGLTEEELGNITPAEIRTFVFRANSARPDYGLSLRNGDKTDPENFLDCGEYSQLGSAPGADLGKIRLDDGTEVEAGRKMMRGSWNASLHKPLHESYTEGQKAKRPDIWIHKNKNSGLWNPTSDCTQYLERAGIRTLLFAGINTDQCVVGTLQDAHARGYDTIMLKDACATDIPDYSQEAGEYNMCRNWGFLSSCKGLARAAGID
jgi:nicotinamidase-related amidase